MMLQQLQLDGAGDLQPAPTASINGTFTSSHHLAWQASNCNGFHPIVLYQPYGVTFADDDIAVAEGFWPYSRVQVFATETGQSLRTSEQNEILPFGITVVGSEKLLAVTDHRDRTVKFLSRNGQSLIASWQSDVFNWPTGITSDDRDVIYVSDWLSGTVSMCDNEGTVMTSFKTSSSTEFTRPVYIAVDSHRRIIVTDAYNHSVSIFDKSGKMLQEIKHSSGSGVLEDPRGVCLDQRDNIIVADWAAGAVRRYSPEGVWIDNLLDKDDDILFPWGIAIDNKGYIALTEQKLGERSALKVFK
jgi:DNA-binding beta-propeller fold protein YncE